MKSFPFDSEVTYDSNGMPIYDRGSNSQELRAYYHLLYADGVFPNPSTGFQVTEYSQEMSVLVLPGNIVIQGAIGIEENERTLVFEASGSSYDRIDAVVARLNTNHDYRKIDLYVVKGVESLNPVAPELTRQGGIYELRLANVFIAKNTTMISTERITDTRLNTEDCGIVTCNPNKVDTTALFNQYQAALNKFLGFVDQCIDGTEVGEILNKISDLEDCVGEMDISDIGDGTIKGAIESLNTGTGGIILSYADGNYYAQYGEDASSKKVLGEISRIELINALANAGLGLTHDSTPEQIYAALATKYPPNKSLLMAGWTKTGALPSTQSCSASAVKITFTTGSGINAGNSGYCHYTSPGFDISSFKIIELVGISYRVAGQTGYSPYVQLVSSAGNAITIYDQSSAGVGEKKQSNINASYNVSSLSGTYYLRITIPSYNENGHYYNVGAYVNLTKALLSA